MGVALISDGDLDCVSDVDFVSDRFREFDESFIQVRSTTRSNLVFDYDYPALLCRH